MRRTMRWAARVATGVATATVFLVALVLSAVLHLDTAPALRLASRWTSGELSKALEGAVEIHAPRGIALSTGTIECARLVVRDASGAPIITAECVTASVDLRRLVRSLVADDGPIVVDVPSVSIAQADVFLDPERIERALVPTATATDARAEQPSEPRPVTVEIRRIAVEHAWVHGRPEDVHVDADVVDLDAALRIGPPGVALDVRHADVSARNAIDRIGVRADVSGWIDVPEEGEMRLYVDASAMIDGRLPATITFSQEGDWLDASVVVPPVSGEALGGRAPRGSLSGRARARGELPELSWSADVALDGASATVTGTASLSSAPRIQARGAIGHADLRAFVDDAPASDLSLSLDVDLALPEAGPRGRATLRAQGRVGGRRAPDVVATAVVEPRRLSWTATATQAGNVARSTGSLDLAVSPPSGRARLSLAAPHLESVVPLAGLERGRIDGVVSANFVLGETPEVDAELELHLRALKVASARLGSATIRGQARAGATPYARVEIDGADLWMKRAGPAQAHVDAVLRGRNITLNASAALGDIGHVFVNTSTVELSGPPMQVRSWRDAVGAVQLDTELDLARLAAAAPARAGLPDASGKVLVLAEVSRVRAGRGPRVEIFAQTRGLAIAPKTAPAQPPVGRTVVSAPPPWRLAGVDAKIDAAVEPDGAATARGMLSDRLGPIVWFGGAGVVPLRELMASRGRALERLANEPVSLSVRMPTRPLSSLPVPGVQRLGGDVWANVSIEGTVARPRARVDARFACLSAARDLPSADVALTAAWDAGQVAASAQVEGERGGNLSASAQLDTGARTLPELLAGPRRRWTAQARAEVESFPIESLLAVASEDVRGRVTGNLAVQIPAGAPSASAELAVTDLVVAGARYEAGHVRGRVDAREIVVDAELRQRVGFARASLTAPIRWRGRTTPEIDPGRELRATTKADRFRIAALGPLLEADVARLDGWVDADVQVVAGPGGQSASGRATLERGVVHLPTLGQELSNVRADATLTPDGVLKVERVSARSLGGRMLAAASGRLAGTDLVGLRAAVRIPKNTPMPLTLQGQGYGDVWGDARIDVASEDDGLKVDAWLDRIRVELLPRSPHTLQELEPDPHVRIGTHRRGGELVLLPLGPPEERRPDGSSQVRVGLHLRDVEVTRGDGMRVRLGGDPTFVLSDELRGSGQIVLRGGVLDVQGKRFEIERGTVSFEGRDMDNPDLVVTAGWTAPDGTRVHADFVGPLQTGRVSLRSEPPMPRDQILALILFGTPSGPDLAPEAPGGGAERVLGLGGGVATQGLNRAIDDLTGLDVTTRIDTSEASSPRPELEVRIAKDLSLQIAHVLGTPPPWGNPDRNFVTLTWRVGGAWSLETTVGDEGSSIVDLIWQRSY